MNSEANPETPANVCPSCGQEQLGKTNRCWKCGVVLIERKRYAPIQFPHYQVPPNIAPSEIGYFDDVILAEVMAEVALATPGEELAVVVPAGEADAPVVAVPSPLPRPPHGIPIAIHQGSPFQPNRFAVNVAGSHAAQLPESVWMPGMEHYSARGGAVAAFVLGFITILGGLLTGFALLNGVLGIGLGIWGLNSTKKKMAMIGIGLCIVGMLLAIVVLIMKASSPTGSGLF